LFYFSGDVCDSDIDGDGVNNDIDNCVYFSNPTQTDSNGKYKLNLNYHIWYINRNGGVMVSVLAASAVDRGFQPQSGQTL